MAAMFSENAQRVLEFLQANPSADVTANDIAEALGMAPKSVNGTVTGLQKKGLTVREEQDEKVDGKIVKFIKLTPAGLDADPQAEKPTE